MSQAQVLHTTSTNFDTIFRVALEAYKKQTSDFPAWLGPEISTSAQLFMAWGLQNLKPKLLPMAFHGLGLPRLSCHPGPLAMALMAWAGPGF